MFRVFFTILFLSCLSAICAQAGTVTCNGTTTPSVIGSVVNCSGNPGSGEIEINSIVNASVAAHGVCVNYLNPGQITCGEGSASYTAVLSVDFTSAPAGLQSGYFTPCMAASVNSDGSYADSTGSAFFGGVGVNVQNANIGNFSYSNCNGTLEPAGTIAFKVGTAQSYLLNLFAFGEGTDSQVSSAFSGFEVFDSNGANIGNGVTYTISDIGGQPSTPEPRLAIPVLAAMLGLAAVRRKR